MSEEKATRQGQETLEDGRLPVQEKPWQGVCCKSCYYARTEKSRCKCRCRGTNHQKGRCGITTAIPEGELKR